MSNGTNCPNCKKDIGIKSIILSITPNRINCPNCGVKLRYRKSNLITLMSFAALLFTMPLSVSLKGTEFFIFLGILFSLWLGIEFLIATYMRHFKILKLVKPRQVYIFKIYKYSGLLNN